jgi:hypothetical protein
VPRTAAPPIASPACTDLFIRSRLEIFSAITLFPHAGCRAFGFAAFFVNRPVIGSTLS